jgi:hypothetical protein
MPWRRPRGRLKAARKARTSVDAGAPDGAVIFRSLCSTCYAGAPSAFMHLSNSSACSRRPRKRSCNYNSCNCTSACIARKRVPTSYGRPSHNYWRCSDSSELCRSCKLFVELPKTDPSLDASDRRSLLVFVHQLLRPASSQSRMQRKA